MAAHEVQIADAVVAELNDAARSWTGQFTAVRGWLPVYAPQDLASLTVTVVPLTLANERIHRTARQFDYGVAIDFQKRVTVPVVNADLDALTELAEDVHDWFLADHELTSLAGWTVRGAERADLYDLDQLYAQHTWETLILLNVRGYR